MAKRLCVEHGPVGTQAGVRPVGSMREALGLNVSDFMTPPREEWAPERQEWTDAWTMIQLLRLFLVLFKSRVGPTASISRILSDVLLAKSTFPNGKRSLL